MRLQVQSLSLTLKPSKSDDNALTRLCQNIGMYLYIWVNLVTLIRTARAAAASFDEQLTIVSMQATIKPAAKKPASPTAAVMEVIP